MKIQTIVDEKLEAELMERLEPLQMQITVLEDKLS